MKPSSKLLLLLLLGTCSAYPYYDHHESKYENVALQGTATQSSQFEEASADKAIDGNLDHDFSHGSCSHTETQTNPWWRVDLLDYYMITSILIINRGDGTSDRIDGTQVHIGDSLKYDGVLNPMVGEIPEIPAGRPYTMTFKKPVEGRYVILTLTGHKKILTLCEVVVNGYLAPSGENLALQGHASQSTLYSTGIAYNAIDGNRASTWAEGSCAHTGSAKAPWWRLDLGKTHKVFSVKITNYYNTPSYINGAEIRIGDSLDHNGNHNPRCAVIESMAGGFTQTFDCWTDNDHGVHSHGMDGRYVNVVVPGRSTYLVLCEVEVYGSTLD